MGKRGRRLIDVEVEEISFVTEGANRKKFALMKAEGSSIDDATDEELAEVMDEAMNEALGRG